MEGRNLTDPLSLAIRDKDKSKGGKKRIHKLNKSYKSPISYKRRFFPKQSKITSAKNRYIFLYRYRLVLRLMSDMTGLTPNQVEFVVAAASFDYFYITEMIDLLFLTNSFRSKDMSTLSHKGYVQVHRYMSNKLGYGHLYKTSYKGKKLAERFYKFVLGELPLPKYVE
jgi:hypothetical protein